MTPRNLNRGTVVGICYQEAPVLVEADVGIAFLAMPLAAGVAASVGFVMPPSAGAALKPLSTIVVAFNARLLGRVGSRLGLVA